MGRLVVGLFAITIAGVLLAGCGAVNQAETAVQQTAKRYDMKILGLMFYQYHDQNRKGPAGWDELIVFAESSMTEHVDILKRLQSRGVVFFCDVKIEDAVGGTTKSIFAYEPSTPQGGGIVTLMDGSVHQMTAEQFNNMLDEQKKNSPRTVETTSR